MDVQPLLDAPLLVQAHVMCALAALALTPAILMRRKGDRLHKMLGRSWVAAMALTALSSFGIMDIRLIGPFSPIHALSLLTLFSLGSAIYYARHGKIDAHQQGMLGAMFGLVGAGVFTVLPGRLMSDLLFPNMQMLGFLAVLALGAISLILWRASLRTSKKSSAA